VQNYKLYQYSDYYLDLYFLEESSLLVDSTHWKMVVGLIFAIQIFDKAVDYNYLLVLDLSIQNLLQLVLVD
jgi:hypothetical protein